MFSRGCHHLMDDEAPVFSEALVRILPLPPSDMRWGSRVEKLDCGCFTVLLPPWPIASSLLPLGSLAQWRTSSSLSTLCLRLSRGRWASLLYRAQIFPDLGCKSMLLVTVSFRNFSVCPNTCKHNRQSLSLIHSLLHNIPFKEHKPRHLPSHYALQKKNIVLPAVTTKA